MKVKVIAFFNNKGGVGKTSLVYHLAWMLADRGIKVVAVDLDPQANLSSMFLQEDRLEELWPDDMSAHPDTILGAISPIVRGLGDIVNPHIENIHDNIGLVVGDMGLSSFEDKLSDAWPRCSSGDEAAFRVMSAFYRIALRAREARQAQLVLFDVGPNLGAINRSAIIASDYIAIPLAPDLYSLQGLRNLGPRLTSWGQEWKERLTKNPDKNLQLPAGTMKPVGYVTMQHSVRRDRPVKAYDKWMKKIPNLYRDVVLNQTRKEKNLDINNDRHCLSKIKHYQSLMPMSQEAHKPMFFLKPADGAIGSHAAAVGKCYDDFHYLAQRIAKACDIEVQ